VQPRVPLPVPDLSQVQLLEADAVGEDLGVDLLFEGKGRALDAGQSLLQVSQLEVALPQRGGGEVGQLPVEPVLAHEAAEVRPRSEQALEVAYLERGQRGYPVGSCWRRPPRSGSASERIKHGESGRGREIIRDPFSSRFARCSLI